MSEPQSITPHAERLLSALRDADSWVTRTELAQAMNKRRINKWEIALLEMLKENGFVEIQTRPHSGKGGIKYVYRAR